jgi:hypothetical protein
MTETKETVNPESSPEKKEKVKKEGTPTWMSKWMVAIKSKDFSEVNFRRKHPRLGSKIGNLEARLKRVEKRFTNVESSISIMKFLLSDELKKSLQKKKLEKIEKEWKDILKEI